MQTEYKVLIVDDEEIVCASCARILNKEGYRVETCTDSRAGLSKAVGREYDAVLLDLKMDHLDGLEFLGALREQKPNLPVIMITGYPTEDNAADSLRLGASDYILKPFEPQEITESLRTVLGAGAARRDPDAAAARAPWESRDGAVHFLREGWMRAGVDGSVRIGAFIPRGEIESIELPRVGDRVYRGLPFAALSLYGRPPQAIPSPLTGTITEINDGPAALEDPCGQGWIARVAPADLAEDLARSTVRDAVLVSGDANGVAGWVRRLAELGCTVAVESEVPEKPPAHLVLLDAAWLGERGPEALARLRRAAPSVRIVVAARDARYEAAYRAHGIFYYAIEPFADDEIRDILAAAYVGAAPPVPVDEETSLLPKAIGVVRITNRRRTRVSLLVLGDLLAHDAGVGLRLLGRLAAGAFPVETVRQRPRDRTDSAYPILDEARRCDRLFVLRAEDTRRLPGALTVDPAGTWAPVETDAGRKIAVLSVQAADDAEPFAFDAHTAEALAEHIATLMATA